MYAIYDALLEWQEVIGAILAGLFALWVALLISSQAQHRSEKVAAHVVISSLADFLGTAKMWFSAWEREPGKENIKRVFWIADRVIYGWPYVASDLEAARATLMDVDWEIGGRLDVFQKAYRSMCDARVHILELARVGKFSQSSGVSERHSMLIVLGLEAGAREAEVLIPLIESLVLSRRRGINRLSRQVSVWRHKVFGK
jgi:hypothetical protein